MNNKYLIGLLAAFASLFSLQIGTGYLRVTLGIVIVIVALLSNPALDVLSTVAVSGVMVFLMRVFVSVLSTHTFSANLILLYALELLFYLGYGLFFKYLVRNEKTGKENSLIILLILCDFAGNTLEYLVRFFFADGALLQTDFTSLFLSAFIRSAVIWLVYEFVVTPRQMTSDV